MSRAAPADRRTMIGLTALGLALCGLAALGAPALRASGDNAFCSLALASGGLAAWATHLAGESRAGGRSPSFSDLGSCCG